MAFSCSSHRSVTIFTSGSWWQRGDLPAEGEGAAAWPGILSPHGAASEPLARSKCWVMLSAPLSSPSSGCYWSLSFAECQGLSVEAEGHLPQLFLGIPAVSMHVSMRLPLFLCICCPTPAALMGAGGEAGCAPACYLECSRWTRIYQTVQENVEYSLCWCVFAHCLLARHRREITNITC